MKLKHINWIGFMSGILLIAVILLSLNNPWWQLRIGDIGYLNCSPLQTDFTFLGTTFTPPLLSAINISCLFLLTISAALMITYSVNPTKAYSKQLLYWSYKPPLIILITFIAGIVVLSHIASLIANQYIQIDFSIPIIGTSIIPVPSELLSELHGAQINIAVSGAFQWTFYLAIAAIVLCITTRFFDKKAYFIDESAMNASTPSN